MAKKNKKTVTLGPVLTIVAMIFVVIILSFIFSKLGIVTSKSELISGEVATTNIGVNNLLSGEGIKYIFSSIINNFKDFSAIYVFIVSLIGIGIADNSGLLRRIFKGGRKFKLSFILILTMMVGCLTGGLGVNNYAILLPLTAYIYKNLNKNPLLGLFVMFFSLTIGQATGILPTILDKNLGEITQMSAIATVDKSFTYKSSSTIYIVISSLILFIFLGRLIFEKYLIPKLPKLKNEEEIEELELTNHGLKYSLLSLLTILVLTIYAIIPGLPASGFLLGDGINYLERLLGSDSPFAQSYVFIFSLMMAIPGMIYGFKSGKYKNADDFTRGFSTSFSGMSLVFVLMFLASQLIALFSWSNLDIFLLSLLINLLSSLQITGMALIIIYFLIIAVVSILVPDSVTKWQIIAPIAVPLLMRANITANYAQFIFIVADGIGKSISILFPYTIVLFGLLYKYTDSGNYGFVKIYKLLSPVIILFTIVWIIIIITWYVVGIPTGIGVLPSL